MGTAYYDPYSIALRLDRTICMYQGRPVFVECPGRDNEYTPPTARNAPPPPGEEWHKLRMYEIPIGNTKTVMVDYRDKDFDYRAMPLGYVNYNGSAIYLSRVPSRQQKQGLCKHSIHVNPNVGGGWWCSREMKDMLLNIYPTVKTALQALEDYDVHSVGVERSIAFSRGTSGAVRLYYRGRSVGFRTKGGVWKLVDSRDNHVLLHVMQDFFKENGLCLETLS